MGLRRSRGRGLRVRLESLPDAKPGVRMLAGTVVGARDSPLVWNVARSPGHDCGCLRDALSDWNGGVDSRTAARHVATAGSGTRVSRGARGHPSSPQRHGGPSRANRRPSWSKPRRGAEAGESGATLRVVSFHGGREGLVRAAPVRANPRELSRDPGSAAGVGAWTTYSLGHARGSLTVLPRAR